MTFFLRLLISRFNLWSEHWPLKWQLRNLALWLRVRYVPSNPAHLSQLSALSPSQKERLELYCQLQQSSELKCDAMTARNLDLRKHSYYVGDLLAALHPRYLDQRFVKEFGDVTWIPKTPTFVKSRPISKTNQNSVLLPLDIRRHMRFPCDPYIFADKKSLIVWRGAGYQSHRQRFLSACANLPFCDIGDPGISLDHAHYKPRLSIHEQLKFKYIISIEGNDVATNLKWIMHSNSLCIMPKPRFETWFLESRLIAGIHYAELDDDFSNLESLFAFYNSHPAKALEIIENAKKYCQQFLNYADEKNLSEHVCSAYFLATNDEAQPLIY